MALFPSGVIKFLSGSVIRFSETASWLESASSCQIQLAEDFTAGDLFMSGTIGQPIKFTHGSGQFNGIIQSVVSNEGSDGKTYSVNLQSPTEILDGVKVIISNYSSPISGGIYNLFNVFGYYESLYGFGGAYSNEAGMVWNKQSVIPSGNPNSSGGFILTSGALFGIKPGFETLQAADNPFGHGIQYRGYNYTVNFSNLPSPPSYYRIGGGTVLSLREIVDVICKDGGVDYLVDLQTSGTINGNVITFKTVSRTTQPAIGKIAQFIASQSGHISSITRGLEFRNEETTLYLVGGQVQTLMLQTDPTKIVPFFGVNLNGYPYLGTGIGDNYTVTVDAYTIADLIGSTSYSLSVRELRLALGSEDLWAAYLSVKNPILAASLHIPSTFSIDDGDQANTLQQVFAWDFIRQNTTAALEFSRLYNSGVWVNNYNRLFNFVKNFAEQFYGRYYLVETPLFINGNIDPDAGNVIYSYTPHDAGYSDFITPLGLTSYYQKQFQNDDNTFGGFVKIANSQSGDYTGLGDTKVVLQGNDLYMPSSFPSDSAYSKIFYNGTFNAAPSYVVVEASVPLYTTAPDSLGGVTDLANLFGVNLNTAVALRSTILPGTYHPAAITPTAVAMPFISPTLTYGPWISGGPAGKVEFRQKPELVPWNYGGYDVLNVVARAELQNFVTAQQVEETASLVVDGLPELSLGDRLVTGGPVVTDMSTNISREGITTNYNMRTYTPRPGQFSREKSTRLQKVYLGLQQINRTIQRFFR